VKDVGRRHVDPFVKIDARPIVRQCNGSVGKYQKEKVHACNRRSVMKTLIEFIFI
jgi:hypothetical protein